MSRTSRFISYAALTRFALLQEAIRLTSHDWITALQDPAERAGGLWDLVEDYCLQQFAQLPIDDQLGRSGITVRLQPAVRVLPDWQRLLPARVGSTPAPFRSVAVQRTPA